MAVGLVSYSGRLATAVAAPIISRDSRRGNVSCLNISGPAGFSGGAC